MAEMTWDETGLAGIQYASNRYARRVAEEVQQDMVDMCPVDTGLLQSTIRAETVDDTVYVYVSTHYWQFVEFGTSKMRAQPFIRPALMKRRNVVGFEAGIG